MADEKKRTKTKTKEFFYMSFSASAEEIASYKEVSGWLDRSAAWWIRDVLNKAVVAAREKKNENQTLEVVPADRPVDHPDRG
jgi:hypothetical protein